MNMSWVYEELEKLDLQLEFSSEEVVAPFERHIEERLDQYMVWRVFGHKADEETKWEMYSTDVWGFVHDEVIQYHRKNPKLLDLLSKCGSCNAWQQLNCDDLCKDCEVGVERCPSCDKEGITVSITLGDGQKSLAQAKEVMAKLEAVLEEKEEAATWAALTGKTAEALNILGIGSNSSASVTPIAPFVTPRRMKEQMAAACEEAKGKEEEESFEDWAKTTTVTGIVCSLCNNELPPMTAQEHLDGKFNQTCPHKETKASPAEEKPRMVVVAHYHISNQYRIPKGIDLHDKEQVDSWGVKWDTLEICLKNGECIEVAPNFAINDSELKRPCDTTIEEDDNQGDDDDDA